MAPLDRRARPRVVPLALLVAASALACAHATAPRPVKLTRAIEPGPVRAVDVSINMASGTLQVNSGACALVHTDLEYDAERSDTRVRYSVREARGELVIEERRARHGGRDRPETRWDLCFGTETPLHVRVELGAGNSALNVAALDLRSLELEFGAGNAELDLRGDYRTDLHVDIDGGTGNVTVHVPRGAGVRVRADKGVGNITAAGLRRVEGGYVNAAYGGAARTIELSIDVGVGNINVVEG